MGMKFNADEVLEMAVKIEQSGAVFYRTAAEKKKDAEGIDFLKELAVMEDEHEKTFQQMRDDLSDDEKAENTYDPAGEISMYLEAMADAHGGEGSPKAADSLTGNESLAEILDIAIGLEKESILFYIGLQDMVPERLGRDKIANIIAEERSHITTLAQKIKSI